MLYLAVIIVVLCAIASFVWMWLRSAAYIVHDDVLLYPNGQPVPVYDGNDPKHFPKWKPFVPAAK